MFYRQGLAIVVAVGLGATSAADELADAGRRVIAEHGSAVVTLKLVIRQKMSFGGFGDEASESVYETTGTVIDDAGLILTSLLATNPAHFLEDLFMEEEEFQMEMSSSLEGIAVLLENGREISAKIVLRDQDLDLAFIRPDEPSPATIKPVDLSKELNPKQFDQVIIPYRLGRVGNRQVTAAFPRLDAIMEKPRPMYLVGFMGSEGSPAFTEAGECLGVVVTRKLSSAGGGGFNPMSFSADDLNMAQVVVPGPDILEIAEQAPDEAAEKDDAGEDAEEATDENEA